MPISKRDTRSRLIETAGELLWERSYHGTSVDDLCARADARKGSFYHFFPSKNDLACAAIQEAWERTKAEVFEPIFGGTDRGLSAVHRFLEKADQLQRDAQQSAGHYLGCQFGTLGQELAHQDDVVREIVQDIFEEHCSYLDRALVQAIELGEIPSGDTRRRARQIFALLEGAFLLAKVANSPAVFRELAPAVLVLAKQA